MPDLTMDYLQVCAKTDNKETVTGSKGETYEVYVNKNRSLDNCDCRGFEFRRTCKHVVAAREKLCQWDEQSGKPQTPQQEMEGVCPECGSETRVEKQAV